jgi:hypothetical protein
VASIPAAPARLRRSASDKKSRGRGGARGVGREEGEAGEKSGMRRCSSLLKQCGGEAVERWVRYGAPGG